MLSFQPPQKRLLALLSTLLVQKDRTNSTNWGPEHPDNRAPCGLRTLSKVLLETEQAYGGVIRMYGVCMYVEQETGSLAAPSFQVNW